MDGPLVPNDRNLGQMLAGVVAGLRRPLLFWRQRGREGEGGRWGEKRGGREREGGREGGRETGGIMASCTSLLQKLCVSS